MITTILPAQIIRHKQIVKYLISGGTSAVANLFLLYVFTDLLGIYYLLSSIFSFVFAVMLGFTLQKFWTFKGSHVEGTRRQAVAYLSVAISNAFLNTILLYLLVEYAGIHYLLAQFINSAMLAIGSFIIYKKIIFLPKISI